jgi:hypothetical protein
MRTLLTIATVLFIGVNAIFEENDYLKMLEGEDNLNIPYDINLACGACVRAGFTYCIDRKSSGYGKPKNDVCCDSAECVLKQIMSKDL